MIDFEKLIRRGIDAIEVKFEGVEEYLRDYDCDSIIVLKARGVIESFDAKQYNKPITEYDLYSIGYYKQILDDVDLCYMKKTPEDKVYIYCEKPDIFYGFKTMIACLTDGRIVEICGFTLPEAKAILQEVFRYKENIESRVHY